MILLDEHLALVHDEEAEPSEAIRTSLMECGAVCTYAEPDILYRFDDKDVLFVASLSRPKFHTVSFDRWDRKSFQRSRRLATDQLVVRDIGCEKSMVYLDDYSFTIPTELLLR